MSKQAVSIMSTFGSRLRAERISHGLTQMAFAELGGVQPNAQGHYESGFRLPKVDYLLAISALIDVAYLITNERSLKDNSEFTKQEHDIVATLRRMSQKDREGVSQLFVILGRYVN
jgi:transcriptional regulator with XRE-family HTH domain